MSLEGVSKSGGTITVEFAGEDDPAVEDLDNEERGLESSDLIDEEDEEEEVDYTAIADQAHAEMLAAEDEDPGEDTPAENMGLGETE